MDTVDLARLISNFNVVAISVMAFFAICGVLAFLDRKLLKSGFLREKIFITAFGAAAVIAFALEATAFNIPYYLRYFAGPVLQTTEVPPDTPNFIRTTEGSLAEILVEHHENGGVSSGIKFTNIDRKITSIHTEITFEGTEMARMVVKWTDGGAVASEFTKALYQHLPFENYTPLQPIGNVKELTVMFSASGGSEASVNIASVTLNKPIPFYFSGLRLFAISFLLFALFVLIFKPLRVKAAYYLFERRFDPASMKQNVVYALTVAALILFSWVSIYSTNFSKTFLDSRPTHQIYHRFLVDALISGRTWLDHGNPEKMLEKQHEDDYRPYHYTWRIENGYKVNVDWMWEWSWYKGKYYSYFGVVPAAILLVPYKLITGEYMTIHGGMFLFAAVAIIFMALIWRFCVMKYMPDTRFAFYMLSFLALYFTCGFFSVLAFTRHYCLVQLAGFSFAVVGTYLLLKATENDKINNVKLFFACLCFALTVGCRPNFIFASLLVPLLVFKPAEKEQTNYRKLFLACLCVCLALVATMTFGISQNIVFALLLALVVLWRRKSWKLLAFISVPYILVAIPLCLYNYARFESFTEFGGSYVTGMGGSGEPMTPITLLVKQAVTFLFYVFQPAKYTLYFPYIECFERQNSLIAGVLHGSESGAGLINFPIVFCLIYLFRSIKNKVKPAGYYTMSSLFVTGAVMLVLVSSLIGIAASSSRYMMDFAFYIFLPALFCAYWWCNDSQSPLLGSTRLKIVYAALALSVIVGMVLFVTGGLNYVEFRNPTLYRYLEYSLGFALKAV